MRAPSMFQYFSNVVGGGPPSPSLGLAVNLQFNQADGATPIESVRSQTWAGTAAIASNALHVPGDGSYRVSTDNDYDIGTGAFKVAAKFHLNSLSSEQFFFSKTNVAAYPVEWSVGVAATYLVLYYGTRGVNIAEIRFMGSFSAGNDYEVEIGRDFSGDMYAKINGTPTTDYQYSPLASGLSFGSVTTGVLNNTYDFSHSSQPLVVGQFGGGYGLCDMEIDYCQLYLQV